MLVLNLDEGVVLEKGASKTFTMLVPRTNKNTTCSIRIITDKGMAEIASTDNSNYAKNVQFKHNGVMPMFGLASDKSFKAYSIEKLTETENMYYVGSYDDMIAYIQDTPAGANGVVFSPWMHGNRCPFDDANSRGVFFNLDITTHGSDLMKAVIEGVCLHMRWLLECTEGAFRTKPVVRFAGGSAISPYICQVMADVLGRQVETERVIQILNRRQKNNPCLIGEPGVGKTAIAEGLAQKMAVSFGMLKDIKDIKRIIQVSAVYRPRPENTAVYDKILPVFQTLYKDNKKSFAALNG